MFVVVFRLAARMLLQPLLLLLLFKPHMDKGCGNDDAVLLSTA